MNDFLKFMHMFEQIITENLREGQHIVRDGTENFRVHYSSGGQSIIFGREAYENYLRNPSKEQLHRVAQNMARLGTWEGGLIFPAVRAENFHHIEQDFGTFTVVHDPLAEGIEVIYLQDSPQSVSMVLESQLPKGYTLGQVKQEGWANLRQQGWIAPTQVLGDLDFGKVLIFEEQQKVYTAQFFYADLVAQHLGTEFYLAFPNNFVAMVLQPSPKADQKDLAMFHLAVTHAYRSQPKPLSRNVYRVTNGRPIRVL